MSGFIDISTPLRQGLPVWPGDPPFELSALLSISRGDPCNLSAISMSCHAGTHIDAPRHYFDGAPSAESAPLDALIGPARVIEAAEPLAPARIDLLGVGRGERILLKTGGRLDALTPGAAIRLAQIGIALIGVDALSIGANDEAGEAVHKTLLGAGVWILEMLDLSRVSPGEYDLIALPLKIIDADGAPARAILHPRS